MNSTLHAPDSIAQLANDALHDNVRALVGRSNLLLAALLAHLAEVEARGIHRERACSTLPAYCVYELRMSEDAAYKRARAAVIARQFPALFGMLAAGEIHLTGVLMLGPHLTAGNHVELLARARFRTKREIAQLLARIAPYADVPAVIEPIAATPSLVPRRATYATFAAGLAGPYRSLRPGDSPGEWVSNGDTLEPIAGEAAYLDPSSDAEGDVPLDSTKADGFVLKESSDAEAGDGSPHTGPRPNTTETEHAELRGGGALPQTSAPERNLAPLRYRIQFSASQEYVDLLERARDLLSHEVPTRDLEQVQLRAMRELVSVLEKRRYGSSGMARTCRPREDGTQAADVAPAADQVSEPGTVRRAADPAREPDAVPAPPGEASPGSRFPSRVPPPEDGSDAPLRSGRYIPAAVRRAVGERDQGRCAYIDDRGTRCRETAFLEYHHRQPHARGGGATTDNLCLMCKAHNALAAEQDYGRSFMERKVAERRIDAGLDAG